MTNETQTASDAVAARPTFYFIEAFNFVARCAFGNSKAKGFWPAVPTEPGTREQHQENCEKVCLIHTEIAEVTEAYRHGNPYSEKIPSFTHAEEELADAVIRIMDLAEARKYRLAEAILAKMTHNTGRPSMHGKLF